MFGLLEGLKLFFPLMSFMMFDAPPAPAAITAEGLNAVQGDAFRALLPADIQAKPYVKEINSFTDLVKKLDGAQGLLGQRQLPDENTPPEKWGEFHSKFRPETPDKYTFDPVEGLDPKYTEKATGLVKIVQGILHKAGASSYQAKIFIPQMLKELFAAEQNMTTARDTRFTELSKSLFGEKKDEIIANGRKFLATHLPEKVKPLLESFDEKQLTAVLAVTDELAKKFTGEDPFRGGGPAGGGSGVRTEAQIVADMQVIFKDPAYGDPFKDKVKNQQLKDKMNVLRTELRKIQTGA